MSRRIFVGSVEANLEEIQDGISGKIQRRITQKVPEGIRVELQKERLVEFPG